MNDNEKVASEITDTSFRLAKEKEERSFKIKAAAFLTGVTGVSILFGFGATLAAAKKRDPHFFDQGLTGRLSDQAETSSTSGTTATSARIRAGKRPPPSIVVHEPGASLALRALGWGTLYSVAGCTIFFYGIWKLMAVNDMKEFRHKVGNWLPAIRKNDPPQGRTEFSGINDLLQYIIDVDKEQKQRAKTVTPTSTATTEIETPVGSNK